MDQAQQAGLFPDTRWSLILRIRSAEGGESAAKALNELCQVYWQPLYVYLRRTGCDTEAAKDTVQGFLAHFLSKNGFERVQPSGGRFRNFLLCTLRNFLISEVRKQTAIKRGGNVDLVPLDFTQAEEVFQIQAAEALSPEAAFDRQWAQTVLSRALQRLREEQRARGREHLFDILRLGLTQEARQKHSAAAAAAGLSAPAAALATHRLRRRLRELVVEELSQTVGAQGDLEEELQYFLSIWSK